MCWPSLAPGCGGSDMAMGATLAERLRGPFTGLRTSPARSLRSHAASASGKRRSAARSNYQIWTGIPVTELARSSGNAGLLEGGHLAGVSAPRKADVRADRRALC
jgi:hypothetical protein